MEFGVLAVPEPRRSARTARLLEELGFDTVLFPDSQNLAPEVWGQLMLASQATTRVHLGPGVTNSVTRDPAVTASAALALQAESGGRAVLGIGRGDSSVQRIGKREDRVASFERHLAALQGYLRGEAVDRGGFASRLEWLERVQAPKVPVEVAATGPRVIEVAARHADAICLAVGADPAHLGAVLARGGARGWPRPARAPLRCLLHRRAPRRRACRARRRARGGRQLRPLLRLRGQRPRAAARAARRRRALPARALRHAEPHPHRRAPHGGHRRRVRGLVRDRRPAGGGPRTLRPARRAGPRLLPRDSRLDRHAARGGGGVAPASGRGGDTGPAGVKLRLLQARRRSYLEGDWP